MPSLSSLKTLLRSPWVLGRRVSIANDLARHSKIYDAKLVTVDVFDTALLRSVSHPDDVYALASWRAKQRHHLHEDVASLVQSRRAAEAKAIEISAPAGSEQASIKSIFENHDSESLSTRQALLTEELNTERDVCHGNETIREIVGRLTDRGVRVAFLSDTIFPSDFIKELLASAGYPQPLEVYVSSEFGVAKATGRLFGALAAHLGIPQSDIWHIGDSLRSDVLNARKSGVNPLWYRPKLRIRNPPRSIKGSDHEIQASVISGIQSMIRSTPSLNTNALLLIGAESTGPIFLAFAQWLIKGVKESQCSKVYFLARDAFSTKIVYDALSSTEYLPPAVYLYVSRRSLVYPLIKSLNEESLDLLCNASQAIPLREFFERIGLGEADISKLEAPDGVSMDFIIDPRNSSDKAILKTCFKSIENEVLARFAEERLLLKKYLERCGFGGEDRAAICDVGYSATSQRALARYLEDQGIRSHLAGFYMYTAKWIDDAHMGGSTLGWMEDRGQPKFDVNFMALSWALMDFFCGAPHGTTLGYEDGASGVQPVLRPVPDGDQIAEAQSQVQAGAKLFLDAYMRAFGGLPPIPVDSTRVIGDLARLVRHPTLREATALGGLTWIEGLGSTSTGSKIAEPPSLMSVIANPKRLIEAYRNTLWRPGFVVRLLRSRRLARMIYP